MDPCTQDAAREVIGAAGSVQFEEQARQPQADEAVDGEQLLPDQDEGAHELRSVSTSKTQPDNGAKDTAAETPAGKKAAFPDVSPIANAGTPTVPRP